MKEICKNLSIEKSGRMSQIEIKLSSEFISVAYNISYKVCIMSVAVSRDSVIYLCKSLIRGSRLTGLRHTVS